MLLTEARTAGACDNILRTIVSQLPAEFPASVFIVMHCSPDSPGVLAQILQRVSEVVVRNAVDGEDIYSNRIYIAPPDQHLLITPGKICLSRGPKENRFRPAVDPLFRSAAQVYGPRVIGIILTGGLDDGTAGLWALKRLGGTAIVQNPADALFPSMPTSAIHHVDVDHIVPLGRIAPLLVELVNSSAPEKVKFEVPKNPDVEVKIAKQDPAIDMDVRQMCGKIILHMSRMPRSIAAIGKGGRARFRCHTGHAFSPDSLLAELTEGIEESL